MRNKGFTLIELLAVIVILAIIALIATPIILGIINDSRAGADKETAKLIANNFELAYNTAYMTKGGIQPKLSDIMDKFNMDNVKKDVDDQGKYTITSDSGNVVCTTSIATEDGGKVAKLSCKIGDDEVSTAKATVSDSN